ncbi:MAG: hypothetical protein R2710_18920 [Acidimicrobiales bacterium]
MSRTFAPASPPHEAELAANIVEQLGVVGVTAEAVELATGQLATAIDGTPVDMFPYGWVAPAGSVDATVPPLLSSTSTANPLGSISPDVDQPATAMVTTADTERWALLLQRTNRRWPAPRSCRSQRTRQTASSSSPAFRRRDSCRRLDRDQISAVTRV